MDYLVGAGQGWRVAPRTSTCPMSLRLEGRAFLLSFLWDGMPLGFFLPKPALELCRDSEGWQLRPWDRSSQGVGGTDRQKVRPGPAVLWDEGARALHEKWGRGGGRLLPVVGSLLLSALLQRTFFPQEAGVFPLPLAELQVLLESHNGMAY